MAAFHAASEQYDLGKLDGRLVAFTNMRLDRESVPHGLPNMKSGRYDCIFSGYTRCSGSYMNAAGMQRLADEYQMVASLQKELEAAKISLSQDELAAFSAELLSTEEQEIIAPQMGM